ncbi:MAG: hypothetical protein LHW42_07245, partial [Candidatus Cloacimonetes bacterium]|nr:hypothetical protein [Candidatus Cloacimonadota bacterium]
HDAFCAGIRDWMRIIGKSTITVSSDAARLPCWWGKPGKMKSSIGSDRVSRHGNQWNLGLTKK